MRGSYMEHLCTIRGPCIYGPYMDYSCATRSSYMHHVQFVHMDHMWTVNHSCTIGGPFMCHACVDHMRGHSCERQFINVCKYVNPLRTIRNEWHMLFIILWMFPLRSVFSFGLQCTAYVTESIDRQSDRYLSFEFQFECLSWEKYRFTTCTCHSRVSSVMTK